MQLSNCQLRPTYYEVLYAEAIKLLQPTIMADLRKASQQGKVGNRTMAMKYYDRVSNWHYLIWYSTIILMEFSDAINLGEPVTMDSLIEKYGVECIRKSFACNGLDADIILDLFGISAGANGGISIMRIDGPPIIFMPHPIDEPLEE